MADLGVPVAVTPGILTISDALTWSVVRCLIIASLGIIPSGWLATSVRRVGAGGSRWVWLTLILIPCLVPELLTGFTYRLMAARVMQSRIATETLYAVLLLFRCVSVGAAVRLMLPAEQSVETSLYSWKLLRPQRSILAWFTGWLRLKADGPWRPAIVSWSLMCLVSFQEFETAALLQLGQHPISWSVSLFDAHAARQPLSDSLRMTIAPVLMQLLLVAPSLLLTMFTPVTRPLIPTHAGSLLRESANSKPRRHWVRQTTAVVWSIIGLGLFLIWPLVVSFRELWGGVFTIARQPELIAQSMRQIFVSLAFAAASTIVALRAASWLTHNRSRRMNMVFMLPGLTGSLITSIMVVALMQTPPLRWLYDTWLPLLLGQSLAVMPRALLLTRLLSQQQNPAAVHSARLMGESADPETRRKAHRLIWQLQDFPWFLGGLIICHWCFWDVTVASVLRPVQLEPVVTRLYNEMHYGRTELLTTMTASAMIIPIAAGTLVILIRRYMVFHPGRK
jgi:ABC-type spermidine/putrescine transport system permease subunit II